MDDWTEKPQADEASESFDFASLRQKMKVKEEMEKQKEEFRKRWAIKEDKESEEKETNERETSKEPEKAPLPTGKNFEIV